jgi:hypothetical protein
MIEDDNGRIIMQLGMLRCTVSAIEFTFGYRLKTINRGNNMASTEWNSIDSEPIEASEYYCAFIDILGYKDKSERYFNGTCNLEGRFDRALTNARSVFNISSYFAPTGKIEIRFFSDSIILLLPKSEETSKQLFSLMSFCSILSAHLSFEDLLVRGGISFGPHKETESKIGATFLASIALQKAYLLESKFSKNPRILIDKDLVPMLTPNDFQVVAMEADNYFIHFSPQIINSEGENVDIVLKEMKEIDETRGHAPDENVADKYKWILDYYYWSLSQLQGVDMEKFSEFTPIKYQDFRIATPRSK